MAANGRNAASPADQFAMLGRYNLWSLVRSYLLKMLSAGPADRMKGLLLDRDTMRIVSTTVGKADLQAHEVYIHRQIRDLATMTEHGELSGIAFLRKTSQNIDWLKRHLKTPKMRDFRLFFSYIIEDGEMGNIASVDSKSLVQEVQEFYADYVVLDPHHFLIPVPNDACFLDPAGSSLHWRDGMERIMEGLGALLLGLRCRPVIRFAQSSPAAGKIADALYQHMYQQERELFAFGNMRTPAADHPLVLILDRSEDPVTPLLTQWTYQAMIHELLGLQDNICKLEGTAENPEAPAELKEGVVLSCCQDEFFGKHLYDNWGDLAAALQSEVQRAQKGSKQELQSLEDLKAAVLMVGDVNQQKSIAQKHVQISSELGRIIRSRQLFEVSEVEQELAGPGGGSASVDAQLVREKLQLPGLSDDDRVRLAMLYALRYPQDAAQILSIKTELTDRHGCSRERVKAVQAVLDQSTLPLLLSASAAPMGGKLSKQLHGQGSGMGGLFKRAVTNMRGVENVFTQHKPLLHTLLTDLLQGNLSTAAYPFKGLELAGRGVPRLVVVFVVGGSTYEEAKIVHELNVANQGRCIALLGGNSLLNSRTFINTLLKTSSGSGGSHTIDLN